MKTIKFLFTLITLIMSFSTCTEDPSDSLTPDENKPEPTLVGFPNGLPNTKTIGASGGTITSLDGRMGIEIPAGALSVDTEIGIQPVTNYAPNGNGNAYQLGPEGTKFSKPVKLIFRYTQEISPTMPTLTGIAFQDIDGIWYSPGNFTWDTTTKTVSTETTHFSAWATFDVLQIGCGSEKLEVNESTECIMTALENDLGADELTPIVKSNRINRFDLVIGEWRVNGKTTDKMGVFGKVTPVEREFSAVCTYMAPTKVPDSQNPVNVSAILKDLVYKDPISGKDLKGLQLATQIEIVGERKYTLSFRYRGTNVISDVLSDSASAEVLVKDGMITFSDFRNSPGYIIPASKTYPGNCTTTWTVEGFEGPFDFTWGTGLLSSDSSGYRHMSILLGGMSNIPESHSVCPSLDLVSPASSQPFELPIPLEFNLNDTLPAFKDKSGFIAASLLSHN